MRSETSGRGEAAAMDVRGNRRWAAGLLLAPLLLAGCANTGDEGLQEGRLAGADYAAVPAGDRSAQPGPGGAQAGGMAGMDHGSMPGMDHAGTGQTAGQEAPAAQPAAPAAPTVAGTINGVDPQGRTINVSHGPIPELGWPAMTMDLPVAPSVDLGAVKPGDRATFALGRGADGVYRIEAVEPTAGPQ